MGDKWTQVLLLGRPAEHTPRHHGMELQHVRGSVKLTIWANNENKGYHKRQKHAPNEDSVWAYKNNTHPQRPTVNKEVKLGGAVSALLIASPYMK